MNTGLFTLALQFTNCWTAAGPSEDVICRQATVLVVHVTTRLAFQLHIACREQDDQPLSRIHQTRDVHTNCCHGQSRTYTPLHDAVPTGSLMLSFEVFNTSNSPLEVRISRFNFRTPFADRTLYITAFRENLQLLQ
jgi:hypothetical protein